MEIGVTYDYRCPFARLAHLHVLGALADGVEWDVRFLPFSLGQVHVDDGATDIWERPDDDSGLLALQASVVVRDDAPGRFLDVHRGLFRVRHVEGRRLDPASIGEVLRAHDVDDQAVFAAIATGKPLQTVRDDHEWAVAEHQVWGVPTFIVGDRAAFVRLMEPPSDRTAARRALERIVGMVGGWPELNELKHTTLGQ